MIASKTQLLIDAAMSRWPDVFDDMFLTNIQTRLIEHGGDECEQLYVVREYLLDRARWMCSNCMDCELHKNRMCGSVFGDGTANAGIFVIGEGPSQYDQRTGTPFTYNTELGMSYCHRSCKSYDACFPAECLTEGTALPWIDKKDLNRGRLSSTGEVLRSVEDMPKLNSVAGFLNAALQGLAFRHSWNQGRGVDQSKIISDVYITNVVKCRKVDKDNENQTPTPNQVRTCWRWLDIQLTVIQPKVVILLGSLASTTIIESLIPNFKISDNHAKFGPRHAGTMPKLPACVSHIGVSYHPSYIARLGNRSAEEQQAAFAGLRSVFEKAHKVINSATP